MSFRFLVPVFVLFLSLGYGQNKLDLSSTNHQALVFSVGVERNDVFSTLTYNRTLRSFSISPSFGVGIVHTFFQSNPFGRMGSDFFYSPLNKKLDNAQSISLGIGVGYYFSMYRSPVDTKFHEASLGYRFSYGKRIKLFQKTALGLLRESFQGNTKKMVLIYPNFHFSIGMSYEI